MSQGFQIVLHRPDGSDVRHFDQDLVRLGWGNICECHVNERHAARKHAEIVRNPSGWTLHDLGSHLGTAVNGRRLPRHGSQSLASGDRIVLAPDAVEPALLEFRLPKPAPGPPSSAILGDESGTDSIVASIDLREMLDVLGRSGGEKRVAIELHAAAGKESPAAPGQSLSENTSQLPILGLFKSTGELLLTEDNLDGMLQQVVNLIGEHLPGRRGVVCTIDGTSGEIQPRRFSSEPEAGSREHGARSREQGGAAEADGMPPRPFLISRSILQEAVRSERALLVTSADDDPRFRSAASVREMGIRSAVCVPLYHDGHVAGVIYVNSQRETGPLTSRDLEVLTVLGLMVAAGISQIALRGDVARERALREPPRPLQFAPRGRADHEARAAAGG